MRDAEHSKAELRRRHRASISRLSPGGNGEGYGLFGSTPRGVFELASQFGKESPSMEPGLTNIEKIVALLSDWGGVVLGWFLGLVSGTVVEGRKTRLAKKERRNAVMIELQELAYRLLVRIYWAEAAHGKFNRELIDWMLPLVEKYGGPNPKDNILKALHEYSKGTDEQIAVLARHQQSMYPPGDFWTRQDAPYSHEVARNIHQFGTLFGSRLVDVLAQLSEFNELCENGNFYHRLTFQPGLTPENHAAAVLNAEGARDKMVKRARVVIGKIGALENTAA